jgi:selenocysteine-specific elongation factor
LPAAQAERLMAELGLVVLESNAARIVVLPERWRLFKRSLVQQLAAYHAQNPDLQGIGREKLRLSLQPRLPAPIFVTALHDVARDGEVVLDGSFVRLATHAVRLTPKDEAAWGTIAPLLAGAERFRPPRVRDIAELTGRPEHDVRRLLKLAGRIGFVDELAHDHFFLRSTVHEMVTIVAEVAADEEGGAFAAAQFRDRVANGRKVAIQILEFFDRHRVTLRRGDLRRVNRNRLDLFGPIVLSCGRGDGGESSLVGRSDFKSE